jgi:hypothetical protein
MPELGRPEHPVSYDIATKDDTCVVTAGHIFKPAFSSLSRLWACSTKTMSPVNTRDEIPGGLETPTLANPKPTIKVPSPMPEGSYKMKIHEPKVLKGCGSLEASVR